MSTPGTVRHRAADEEVGVPELPEPRRQRSALAGDGAAASASAGPAKAPLGIVPESLKAFTKFAAFGQGP